MKTHEKFNLFLTVLGFLSATTIGLVGLVFAYLQIQSNNLNVICREPWWEQICKILFIKISPTPSPSITPTPSPSITPTPSPSLNEERITQKKLDEARNLGDHAIDKGRLAKTTDELKEVERMLVEAINKLKQLPRNASNDSDITYKLQGYESALSKVRNASTKVSCNTALFGNCVQLPLSLP